MNTGNSPQARFNNPTIFKPESENGCTRAFTGIAISYDGKQRMSVPRKRIINNHISEYLMTQLEGHNIPTYFLQRTGHHKQSVANCDEIPVEILIRNYATGSFSSRLLMKKDNKLHAPIIEYRFKKPDHVAQPVDKDILIQLKHVSPDELEEMVEITHRVNDFLSGLLKGKGLILADMRLSFGRYFYPGNDIDDEELALLITDEISPDTCRIWDENGMEKLGKERVFIDNAPDSKYYEMISHKLGLELCFQHESTCIH